MLLPFEVVFAVDGNLIMNVGHGVYKFFLHDTSTCNVEVVQEVVSHRNKSIFRPPLVPVDRATADQTRKFQRTVAKLVPHLRLRWRKVKGVPTSYLITPT